MVSYIHVCYIQNLSLLRDKTPQKAENARLRLSRKLWAQCFSMMMWSLVVYSAFIFSAGALPQWDRTWIFTGAELGLSNERHYVMQSWSLRPNFSQVANNCVFFVSWALALSPWGLICRSIKPSWLQLNSVEAVMNTRKATNCSGLWGRGRKALHISNWALEIFVSLSRSSATRASKHSLTSCHISDDNSPISLQQVGN